MINEFGKQLNSAIGVCVWPTAHRRLASSRVNVRCEAFLREGERRANWPAADSPKAVLVISRSCTRVLLMQLLIESRMMATHLGHSNYQAVLACANYQCSLLTNLC